MAIRAKDLAKQLGISEATLSLVLNNKGSISAKTRASVTKKIIDMGYGYMFKDEEEELETAIPETTWGYEPEEVRGCIGFVIYKDTGLFMDNTSFFPLIIDGMSMMAKKYGYRFLMLDISRDMDPQVKWENLKLSGCAGFVVYAPELPVEEVEALQKTGIPFVLLDNYFPGKKIDSVVLDNEQGIYMILEMLKQKGHRKIGYLSGGTNLQSFRERRSNFDRYIKELELEWKPCYSATVGYPEHSAYEGVRQYLKRTEEMPTAFVTDNDCVAFGAIKALIDCGYSVPEDVSVVGFSDRPICMYITPNITTVRIPRMRFGGESVELLITKILSNPYENERSIVKTEVFMELIERESVGPVPKR